MGLLGLRIPEAYGGGEADCVTTGIAHEEIAYGDFNMAYLVLLASLVGDVLTNACDEDQRARFLPSIAAGEAVPALALTEPDHGSDAAHLRMRAERDGDGWRLVGEKTSITLGLHADTALVFARTGGEGARGVAPSMSPSTTGSSSGPGSTTSAAAAPDGRRSSSTAIRPRPAPLSAGRARGSSGSCRDSTSPGP